MPSMSGTALEEQANSAAEKQRANAGVRTVAGLAPHLAVVNFRRRLLMVLTFALLNVRSSVTLR